MDGYFHAAAVVRALAREPWLTQPAQADGPSGRLDEAFALARDAPRAAARYPGHKALLEALEEAPPRAGPALRRPVFDLMNRWATVKDPVLRELVATLLARRQARRPLPSRARPGTAHPRGDRAARAQPGPRPRPEPRPQRRPEASDEAQVSSPSAG